MRAEAVNALGDWERAQRTLPGARVRDPLSGSGSQSIGRCVPVANNLTWGFFQIDDGLHGDTTVTFAWQYDKRAVEFSHGCGHARCLRKNSIVPTPLIVCGPSKKSMAARSSQVWKPRNTRKAEIRIPPSAYFAYFAV